MGMHAYNTAAWRIDEFKGRILGRAMPQECLSRVGRQVEYPKNNSKTYTARLFLPYGAASTNASTRNTFHGTTTLVDRSAAIVNAHRATEGVTPTPDSVTPWDVSCTMTQFMVLYGYTDHTADLGEDDIPEQEEQMTAERITLVNEAFVYGILKAGTNKFYGGTGTSRATVNGPITLNLLREIGRTIMANHGKMITRVLDASGKFNTSPIARGFRVYISTDLSSDVRDLENFVPTEKYASGTPEDNELGACEEYRFFRSPDLVPILDAATSVTASTYDLYSTAGTNPDVYQVIVMAADAFSQVAVRGLKGMEPFHIPHTKRDKSDPGGQRGYVGANWWKGAYIENDGWMAVLEVGRTNLTN
jgi:N4-gp56 family major capsid protein